MYRLYQGLSPRVRGNRRCTRCGDIGRGLSPRVRGNHVKNFVFVLYAGSIPACAGEPPWDSVASSP